MSDLIMVQIDDVVHRATPEEQAQIEAIRAEQPEFP